MIVVQIRVVIKRKKWHSTESKNTGRTVTKRIRSSSTGIRDTLASRIS